LVDVVSRLDNRGIYFNISADKIDVYFTQNVRKLYVSFLPSSCAAGMGVSLPGCEGGWSLILINRLSLMSRLKVCGIVSTITHMPLCLGFYLTHNNNFAFSN
jgi:hypothetical protein